MSSRYQIINKRAEETSSADKVTTTKSSTSTSVVTSSVITSSTTSITTTTVKAVVTTTSSISTTTTSKPVSSTSLSSTTVASVLQKGEEPSYSEPIAVPTSVPPQNNNDINKNTSDTDLMKNKDKQSLYIGIGIASAVGVIVLVLFVCCIMRCRKNKSKKNQGFSRSIPISEISNHAVNSESENQDKSNIPYYQNEYGSHTSYNYSNYNNDNNGSVYSGSGTNTNPFNPPSTNVNANLYSNNLRNGTPSYRQSNHPTNVATVATNSSITCCTNYISSMADYNANSNGNDTYPQWTSSPVNSNNVIISHPGSTLHYNNSKTSRQGSSSNADTAPSSPNSPMNKHSVAFNNLLNMIKSTIDTEEENPDIHSPTQGHSGIMLSPPPSESSYMNHPHSSSFIRNDESCVGQVHTPRNDSFTLGSSSRVISPRIESLCLKNSLVEELRSEYSSYERPPLANASHFSLTSPSQNASVLPLTSPKHEESIYANQSHISVNNHSQYDETMLTGHSFNSIKDSFFSNQDNSTVVRTATIVPEFVESSVVAEALVPEIIETLSSNPSESPRPSLGESSTNGLISTSMSMGERRLSQPPHTGYRSPDAHYMKRLSIQSSHSNKAAINLTSPEKIKPYVPNIIEDSDEHEVEEEIDNLPTPVLEKKKPYVPNIIEEDDHVNNITSVEKKKPYVPNIIEDDHHILDELNFD